MPSCGPRRRRAEASLWLGAAQVTQIRVAGDPTYDTRYSFIEFTTPEEARLEWLPVMTTYAVGHSCL